MNFGLEWQIKASSHPSFIDGRFGLVLVDEVPAGFLGEINPKVLVAWELENPSAAFELNLSRLISRKLL